jgi:ArsR family transcriptional regulator, arsenate/arsenite/antimonite-responsive transcriptional repressor
MQEAYKAIADSTRRLILKYLRGGERNAGELAEYAGVGRTALSHHLTVLKLADLVRVERRGQFQVYSLNTTVFQDLMTEVMGWFGGLDTQPAAAADATVTNNEEDAPPDADQDRASEYRPAPRLDQSADECCSGGSYPGGRLPDYVDCTADGRCPGFSPSH